MAPTAQDDSTADIESLHSLDLDSSVESLEPVITMRTFIRRGTFTRSLRIARERMSKISKRLAKSADDLDKVKEEQTDDEENSDMTERGRSKSMGSAGKKRDMSPKFAISKKNEFDYNAALELEYARWSKQYSREGSIIDLSGATNKEETETTHKTNPFTKNLSFSLPLSEVISRRKVSENKSSSSSSSASTTSSTCNTTSSGRIPIPRLRQCTERVVRDTARMRTSIRHSVTFFEDKPIPGRPALTPLRSEQFVRDTRRTLMLDADCEKCECIITDKDDGDVQFSCILSKEGIVCRNYRTMLDIVSIGSLQQLSEDEPLGVYYTIEGKKDGQIAKIKKGKTLSRIKHQVNLVSDEDRRMLLTLSNSAHNPVAKLPILKQSLLVLKQRRNILKIVTKSNKITIASIQKEMNSDRYWLHLEPNVDSCFVSALASYILRKRIFGDKLPKVLQTQSSSFTRRARRLSLSFKRRKPKTQLTLSSPTSSSMRV